MKLLVVFWQLMTVTIFLTLGGCAALPDDLGRSDVDALVSQRGQTPVSGDAMSLIAELTSEPLSADGAVRLALVNNPTLKATYAELGFAIADVYAAGRIRNPILSVANLDSNRSGQRDQLTLGLLTSFTDLVTLPARKRLARAEFAAVKQTIGARVLATAAAAEISFYRSVGAQQVAALRHQIAKAGGLSEALAQRYHEAGNLTPRDLALAQAAAAEVQLAALAADAKAYGLRTELATVLGLSVGGDWGVPTQLPLPLGDDDALPDLLTLARESRLDLAAARTQTAIVADRLGVTEWTRWLGELDVGIERERETGGARLTGPSVAWELPIFNQNRDALLRVDAELKIALLEYSRSSLTVNNEVHLAFTTMQNAKARVQEFQEHLVPARMAATGRAQEEEAFMLIGIFELLVTKQQEYDAYQGYVEAVRDYWVARAQLTRAVGNTLPNSAGVGDARLDVEDILRPTPADDHYEHDLTMPGSNDAEHNGHGVDHESDGGAQ